MKFLLALILSLNTSFCIPTTIFDISDNNQTEIIQEIEDSNTIDNNEYSARAVKPSSRSSGTNTNNVPTFTTPDEYDTYLEAYYSELQCNFGENIAGTCGYVAIEMLLSYYDTFLNNQIIPQQYNEIAFNRNNNLPGQYVGVFPVPINQNNMIVRHNSPGTKTDSYDIYNIIDNYVGDEIFYTLPFYKQYLEIIENYTDQYFHLKLISLGNDIIEIQDNEIVNLNEYTTAQKNNIGFYDDEFLPGISASGQKEVLKSYLNSNATTVNKYTITSCTSQNETDIKNFIKTQIDLGKPVVTTINIYLDNKIQEHSVICYKYDDDYIYCNMGWRYDGVSNEMDYNKSHFAIGSNIPEQYQNKQLFLDAFVIDFNLPTRKALAYPVYSTTTDYTLYSYDDCRILTFNTADLIHQHNYNIVYSNTDGHYDTCIKCNQVVFLSTHSYIVDGYSFICNEHGHQYNCAVCNGYPICEEHDFMPNYVEYRDDGHYGVCLTSMQLVWMSEHNYEYAYTSGGYDYFYCECGRNYSTPTG